MKRIALIKNGVVVNVVVAESLEKMPPITGCDAIALDDVQPIGFGWTWDGKAWIAPPPPPPPPPSLEDRLTILEQQFTESAAKVKALEDFVASLEKPKIADPEKDK